MANVFDQFDMQASGGGEGGGNVFDQFDLPRVAQPTERRLGQPEVPQWGRENPNLYGLYGAGKALISQVAKPTLETLGAIGGSLASPIVGTSLGYGMGKKAGEIIEGQYARLENPDLKMKTVKEETIGSAVDVGSSLAVGGAFAGAGKAVSAVDDFLFETLPKRLYTNAARMPLRKSWTNVLPGHEISAREAATREGLSTGTPVNREGLALARARKSGVNERVEESVDILSENPDATIMGVGDFVRKALSPAYEQAKTTSDPIAAKRVIDRIGARFIAGHGGEEGILNANEQLAIKRQMYKELPWGEQPRTLGAQTSVNARKAIANGLMKKLESQYPELEGLNETHAARIHLVDALEHGVELAQNNNPIGLGTKVLASTIVGLPLAAVNVVMGNPTVKSRLAIALARVGGRFKPNEYPVLPSPYEPPPPGPGSPFWQPGETGWVPPQQKIIKSPVPMTVKSASTPAAGTVESTHSRLMPDQLARSQRLRTPDRPEIASQYPMESNVGSPLIQRGPETYKSKPPDVSGFITKQPTNRIHRPNLMEAISSLQRPGQARELVSIPKLREASGLSVAEFDRQLQQLVKSGKVALHPHDMPFGISEAERAKLFSIPDPLNKTHRGRTYFAGVVPKY